MPSFFTGGFFQDTNGIVLGRSSKLKVALEEGSRAFIGSKEIEVIPEIHSVFVC